ncbi:hypothetical protein NDU88_005742 [Pleurodeles waltl]|uniref:Uncharacterized protein n=1 Tax=Pleurodeles waltl TaxID=8319 RepID=A0AAV7MBH1_PLEWA|nr:hypothetical protein NDU88_005742 [Pleurodeles waltl]
MMTDNLSLERALQYQVMTRNMQGMASPTKRNRVNSYLKRRYVHLAMLQEKLWSWIVSQCVQQYFEANAGSASSRAMEWDANKVVIRGHCMAASWGIRRQLVRDFSNVEHDLRQTKPRVAN